MNYQIWTEEYKINSFMVNLRGRAGLHTILNLIQDVGWQHAVQAEIKTPKNQGWVFTRQKLHMQSWPQWNEVVRIKTWIRPPTSEIFLLRDYEIFLADRKIGECTSAFSVIDTEKRKLITSDWKVYSHLWQKEENLQNSPEKIIIKDDVQELAKFQVRNSDIDLNQHVNNTKYAQWILDALPISILKESIELKEYQVNFLSETKSGDVISVEQIKTHIPSGDNFITQFQGIREADKKVVFMAQMTFQV